MLKVVDNSTIQEKIDKLRKYYENKGLLIVGLNDSTDFNTKSTILKKNAVKNLASFFEKNKFNPQTIDAVSPVLNKTEHIDYFLKNNVSLEDIKLLQKYSTVSHYESTMHRLGLPKFIGKIGYGKVLFNIPKQTDSEVKISTSLYDYQEPLLIYSSGVSDLMRAIGYNPFRIKYDYQKKDELPNYNYMIDKINNPMIIEGIMKSISQNLNNILCINNNTNIYVLGASEFNTLSPISSNPFSNPINSYNDKLEKICKRYNIDFINVDQLCYKASNKYDNLIKYIIEDLYQKKLLFTTKVNDKNYTGLTITNAGVAGVINDINNDYSYCIGEWFTENGYSQERCQEISYEHSMEIKTLAKVLVKKKIKKVM